MSKKSTPLKQALSDGMYIIMRKIPSYTHFDFFHGRDGEPFYASTFFALLDLISRENEEEKKAYEKANKKSKRR